MNSIQFQFDWRHFRTHSELARETVVFMKMNVNLQVQHTYKWTRWICQLN